MKSRSFVPLVSVAALAVVISSATAQENPADVSPERARANFARPVVLAADDVRLFPEPPAGYRDLPDGALRGRLEPFEYDSAVTGTRRKAPQFRARCYAPPGQVEGAFVA